MSQRCLAKERERWREEEQSTQELVFMGISQLLGAPKGVQRDRSQGGT